MVSTDLQKDVSWAYISYDITVQKCICFSSVHVISHCITEIHIWSYIYVCITLLMISTDLHGTCFSSVYLISNNMTEVQILPYTYICITLLVISTELHDMCLSSVYIIPYHIAYVHNIILFYRSSYFTTPILVTHIYVHHFTRDD